MPVVLLMTLTHFIHFDNIQFHSVLCDYLKPTRTFRTESEQLVLVLDELLLNNQIQKEHLLPLFFEI